MKVQALIEFSVLSPSLMDIKILFSEPKKFFLSKGKKISIKQS